MRFHKECRVGRDWLYHWISQLTLKGVSWAKRRETELAHAKLKHGQAFDLARVTLKSSRCAICSIELGSYSILVRKAKILYFAHAAAFALFTLFLSDPLLNHSTVLFGLLSFEGISIVRVVVTASGAIQGQVVVL